MASEFSELNIKDYKYLVKGEDWSDAFDKAILDLHNIGCNELRVPVGIYRISRPIKAIRGMLLKGTGVWDDNNSSVIKLMNNANCSIFQSPFAQDGKSQTHYIAIENIKFDGNRLNQTEEHTGVDFRGLFVGSWIRNVMISNVRGCALATGNGQDLLLENIWVSMTDTKDYAVSIGDGSKDGLLVIDNIYVENTTNGTNPSTFTNRTNEAIRGKGMVINGANTVNVVGLHMEGHRVGVKITGAIEYLSIDRFTTAHMGNSKESIENTQLLFETLPRSMVLQGISVYNVSNGYKTINTITGKTISGAYTSITPYAGIINYLFLNGALEGLTRKKGILAEETEIPYKLDIIRHPDRTYDWSGINYNIDYTGKEIYTTRVLGTTFAISTNKNKLALKDMLTINAYNTNENADTINLNATLRLNNRSNASYCVNGDIIKVNDKVSIAKGNNEYGNIVTSSSGLGTPIGKVIGKTVGQIYLDTATNKIYICIKENTTQWKQVGA